MHAKNTTGLIQKACIGLRQASARRWQVCAGTRRTRKVGMRNKWVWQETKGFERRRQAYYSTNRCMPDAHNKDALRY
jgi:hypothetical protein